MPALVGQASHLQGSILRSMLPNHTNFVAADASIIPNRGLDLGRAALAAGGPRWGCGATVCHTRAMEACPTEAIVRTSDQPGQALRLDQALMFGGTNKSGNTYSDLHQNT